MRSVLLLLVLFSSAAFAQGPASIDTAMALRCFQEAKWASDDDGGRLWGKPLYGPILFVDPETREIVANQGDAQGILAPLAEGVWRGKLPKEIGVANTAMKWAGTHWSMVMWPLSEDPVVRTRLMMHECWHRIQEELGLPAGGPSNAHLDSKDGRIWLRLEWRALSNALISWGPERKQSITDALTFRAYRRSLVPSAAVEEDRMEVHEGMAEYTGVRLMGLDNWGRRSYLSGRIKVNALKPSYPLSFAYETGPAYGLLIDMADKPWRNSLKPNSSLSETLRGFEGITLPADLSGTARVRAAAYNGEQVFAEEEKRDQTRRDRDATYRKLLVEGPLLELPLRDRNYTYNPNEVFPLGSEGTVYPSTTISDAWGVIEVKKGARVNLRFDTAYVSAPASASVLEGDGWKLTLKPGWKLVAGARKGDFRLVRG